MPQDFKLMLQTVLRNTVKQNPSEDLGIFPREVKKN
jgi:hypothetical protein